MLELKDIKKDYVTGDEKVEALKGVDLKFRESEFVSILGQSGCGKTTLLNIIGGLDRYTSGDLIINGKSTKKFKDRDWDAYRNYKVGFVFQNYNLIGHQTILSNVELALTIGGVSKKERKRRAIKALEEVGLKEQIHKKPNQLSGGQMQRVAIARALVNNPDIILADEPTGALDTKTSVQVMEILKRISKDKLIVMVTHNPELAEKYSSRIIRILDGVITEDSNPIKKNEKIKNKETNKIGRASMSLFTAFRLSLNNLLTKKGRTVLVSFAGSIGIIGIALVLSVSNGFQGYVDHIQEDTLTSYPLTIAQESSNISAMLLSMASEDKKSDGSNEVKEEQYISNVLANVSTNDLQSFKNYVNDNKEKIKGDVSSIEYSYSVEPNIYAKDATGKVAKLNPSNLFNSPMSSSFMMGGTSFSSIYSQMMEDTNFLNQSYDMLAGHWPEKYNEMLIVLSEPNKISDLLVYSLGLRDTEELSNIVTKVMSGEKVDVNNEPMTFSYDDLMNIELKLLMPSDIYKHNDEYDVYEDMSSDEIYMEDLYSNATPLKIVGVVTAKEGVTTMALSPGVAYRSDLVDHIIDYSSDKEIVKKQLENDEVDVFSGNRFDSKKNGADFDMSSLISIDISKIKDAFNIDIDQKQIERETADYMNQISDSITADISPAKGAFTDNLNRFSNEILDSLPDNVSNVNVEETVSRYLNKSEQLRTFASLEAEYVIPKETFKSTYSALLNGLVQAYVGAYNSAVEAIQESAKLANSLALANQNVNNTTVPNTTATNAIASNTTVANNTIPQIPTIDIQAQIDAMKNEIKNKVVSGFLESVTILETEEKMAQVMTEANMKKTILTMVGELTGNLSMHFASAYNMDPSVFEKMFNFNFGEEQITRIVSAMMNKNDTTFKSNLMKLGYQDKEEPTYILFYFTSFDGKERFLDFIDEYNEMVKEAGEDDKEIQYTDTTGILMGSVKTIVNAVTYVLIAFISISLIVSSIMIGIITYISVYERTKEIGILRAMGASKRNISSIFNAETFIIGLLSGLFGIGITYALVPAINIVLHQFTGNIPLDVVLYAGNAVILIVLSIILTLIGGLIPARAASKRDPVIALRTE
ncbi:MAG: ABC transporter ATP-binding protein/permease [Clostridia bacterium]|nr:ABC transporter ATP-binding protein/permease [Bacilli bacterium]MBR3324774.1 ABC transporter ATP-binding protein/permease [Clostridia bacterium]